MSLNNVDELVKDLDWGLPTEVQENAFNSLKAMTSLDTGKLINWNMKGTWENTVLLIDEIGYPSNKQSLPCLLELLQDMSWPGAIQSINVLKKINKAVLIPIVEKAIKKAYIEEDYMWLGGIKSMVKEIGLSKEQFIDKKVSDMLTYADF
jgi:hypothetical protein